MFDLLSEPQKAESNAAFLQQIFANIFY